MAMRRFALTLSVIAVACARTHLTTVSFEHLRSSIVRISSTAQSFDWLNAFKDGTDSVSVGTGFVVQAKPYPLFATNAHVINDASHVTLQFLLLGSNQWEAEVVSVCSKFDLALLVLKDPGSFNAAIQAANITLRSIPLSPKVAMMGQDVVALGFPLGQDSLKFSKGSIAGIEDVNGNMCVQSTAPISPGSSGGPLLNEAGNAIVGVNFAKSTTGENINYVIPAFRVAQLVQKHRENQPTAPTTGSWQRLVVRVPEPELTTEHANEALYEYESCKKKGVFVSRVGRRSFLRNADPPVPDRFFLEAVNGVKIDEFGMGSKPEYAADRVNFDDLFFMTPTLSSNITIRTCHDGLHAEHSVSTSWQPEYGEGIVYVDEPLLSGKQKAFEQFGGVTIMDMTVNHIQQLASQGYTTSGRWLHPDLIDKPRLIVTSVQQGTYAANVVRPGTVVRLVNGKRVHDLEEFHQAFLPAGDRNVWTLETDTGKLLALMFNQSLEQQVYETRGEKRQLSYSVASAAYWRGLTSEFRYAGKAESPVEAKTQESQDKPAETQLLQRKGVRAHVMHSDATAPTQARAAGPVIVGRSATSASLSTQNVGAMQLKL